MSAFQVSPEHIGAIVRFYLQTTPDWLRTSWKGCRPNANDAADMMACLSFECYNSVRYRYPSGPLPGPIAFEDSPVMCDERLGLYKKLTPVEAIKAVDCLAYQSCEHPEWDKSVAHDLLEAIKGAAIAQLPGYAQAEWEICQGAAT